MTIATQYRDFGTLSEMFASSALRFANRPLFGTKREGHWDWMTYAEFAQRVDWCAAGLSLHAVSRGDRVALISNNRVEWAVVAYACFELGAVLVPMYEMQKPEEWLYVIKNSGATVVFAATDRIIKEVAKFSAGTKLRHHFLLDDDPNGVTNEQTLGKLQAVGGAWPATPNNPHMLTPGDLACIIYTSGTTGTPKGVMLTHRNICSNIKAVRELGLIDSNDRSVAFLPWSHVMGSTGELHGLISVGAALAICDRVERLAEDLIEVKPSLLFGVPRVLNKVHAGVVAQIAKKPAWIRNLFAGQGPRFLTDALIYRKIRAKFGGRLRFMVCGSAALAPEVADFFGTVGIPIYEGYGLTEASPIVSLNYSRFSQGPRGSVGEPIQGVSVEIDTTVQAGLPEGEGEIIVHGPNVMSGYYGRPGDTAECIMPDGGLRTGDIGRLKDGYLYITGRIAETFKLENGKFVAAAAIEEQLKLSPFVANAMVYGLNRPHVVALLVPNNDALDAWATSQGIGCGERCDLFGDDRVHALFKQEVADRTAALKGYERIRGFVLLTEDFTQENGQLTPTLKLKRRDVTEKYASTLAKLYED